MNMTDLGRLYRRVAIVAVLTVSVVACGSIFPRPLDPVIKIGLVAPFQGRYRDTGYDVIYSARLAIREANEQSGPGQPKLELVAVDDFGDPETARQTAQAMAVDPDVVAVIGHWLPETTAAARAIYAKEGVPFVAAGEGLLGATSPADLDKDFLEAYEEVTPFDETAGPYAGTAYDGVKFILAALDEIGEVGDTISRSSMNKALHAASYDGMTGPIHMD
jgi:ABC-type branched-subunit amino acid transport system substrate-binding protein